MRSTSTFGTIAMALVIFVCGYLLGYFTGDATKAVVATTSNAVEEKITDNGLGSAEEVPTVEDPDGVAFTINIENIPEAQRTFLRTMGIDGNEIVVTNQMLACAEAKLGSARMTEIQNGATPSMSEGVSLMACY